MNGKAPSAHRSSVEGAGFGRLERGAQSAPMSDINMTPLIDVMLVLLVIFIITAPLLVSAVKVDLPKAAGTVAVTAPKFINVAIDREGQLFANDQPMTADALEQSLRALAAQNPTAELRLRADTAVPYGRVVEVMGLAQKSGLTRVGFVADKPLAATP